MSLRQQVAKNCVMGEVEHCLVDDTPNRSMNPEDFCERIRYCGCFVPHQVLPITITPQLSTV